MAALKALIKFSNHPRDVSLRPPFSARLKQQFMALIGDSWGQVQVKVNSAKMCKMLENIQQVKQSLRRKIETVQKQQSD